MVVINKLGEIDLAGIKSLVIAGDRLDRNLIARNLQALAMNDIIMINPDITDIALALKQRIVDVVFIHAEPDISRTFSIISSLRAGALNIPNSRLPIVLITKNVNESDAKTAMDLSVNDIIIYPISAGVLKKRLGQMILKMNSGR